MRGYTLIEVLVVVALLALATTGATLGVSSLTRGNLRSSSMLVASAVRAGYGRAATQGRTVRLVLDLEGNRLWLEESDDRVVIDRSDESGEGGAAQPTEEEAAEAAQRREDAKAEGEADVETVEGPAALDADGRRRARFHPVPGARGERRAPKGNTKLHAVYTAHEEGRQEDGRHFLYFFPGGMTERAVVQLADPSGEIYSVTIHPLTGRTKVMNVPVEPERSLYEREEEVEGEAPL